PALSRVGRRALQRCAHGRRLRGRLPKYCSWIIPTYGKGITRGKLSLHFLGQKPYDDRLSAKACMSLPRDYFQKLVETCPDIIIAVNRWGTVIFYNDGAQRTLGFTQEEMLGKDVLEIYPSRDEAKKVMSAMRGGEAGAAGKVCNFETFFKTKKGERIPVAISASILYDAAGAELGSIGYAKDIRGIRRREQLETLGEIAIGMSHEINNSLEVLVNQLDMIQQYVGRVASDEEYVIESERLES